jgi:hypothetical protein
MPPQKRRWKSYPGARSGGNYGSRSASPVCPIAPGCRATSAQFLSPPAANRDRFAEHDRPVLAAFGLLWPARSDAGCRIKFRLGRVIAAAVSLFPWTRHNNDERESRASPQGCTSHNGDRKLGGWQGKGASLGRPHIACMRRVLGNGQGRRPRWMAHDCQGSLGPCQSSCIRLGR